MINTINEILKLSGRPERFAESSRAFWDDEHISKGMLDAHLNNDWDAATRKTDFVEKSINWINSLFPAKNYQKLLDLGCGPGIYAESFTRNGYITTGIDFSKRSIEYAKTKSLENNSNIEYIYQNYLDIN